jgi:uncharacterized protein (TIGR00106 family)
LYNENIGICYGESACSRSGVITTKSAIDQGKTMKVIMDLTVSPFGVGLSVSEYIAACHEIFDEAGLKTNLHAYGTNIEGDWDEVMAAVKKCHQRLHQMGVPRLTSSIKVGTRTDREQSMRDKVASVERKLKR